MTRPGLLRLHPQQLARLPDAVQRPAYNRAALQEGIVHLGIGAFMRAHLAVATEAAIGAGDQADLRWGIVGVSLRHPDVGLALNPQQGLYSLALRDADAQGAPRQALQVIGCVTRVLVAPQDPAAVLAAMAAPHTRIVSLSITEKGYCRDPASDALQRDQSDIQHDLAQPDSPRSALGFLLRGLQRRRAAGLGGVTLLSLDNLPANGHTLRGLLLALAQAAEAQGLAGEPLAGQGGSGSPGRADAGDSRETGDQGSPGGAGLADWIATHCRFPSSMVDRIVPRSTAADRAHIDNALGLHDAGSVLAEPFFDWAVEDHFAAGRPDWALGGARFVADAAPYERLKLRLVNGSHSTLAYLAQLAGIASIDAAIAEPSFRALVEAQMRHDLLPTLSDLPGVDVHSYCRRLLQRFANPALAHRSAQVAMDGSQKLPQRLLAPLRERLIANAEIERPALAIAAWLQFIGGFDERGRELPLDDPLAAPLRALWAEAEQALQQHPAGAASPAAQQQRCALLLAYAPVFGDLGRDARFINAVARQALALRRDGVRAAAQASAGP